MNLTQVMKRKYTMAYFKRLIIALFSCSIFFSSCDLLPLAPEPTYEPRSEWINQWLINPTCFPPCFENIIPGKTTIDEALIIAQQMRGVEIINNPISLGGRDQAKQMQWAYKAPSYGGTIVINTDQSGVTVGWIQFNFSTTQASLSLQELFAAYGQPDKIDYSFCRPHAFVTNCFVYLFNKKTHMLVHLVLPDLGKEESKINIFPSSKIENITLIDGGKTRFFFFVGQDGFDFEEDFKDWQGYGTYP